MEVEDRLEYRGWVGDTAGGGVGFSFGGGEFGECGVSWGGHAVVSGGELSVLSW